MSENKRTLSLTFPEIRDAVAQKHAEFMGKYSKTLMRHVAEQEMSRDKIYAKLVLVAKAFVDAGVVDSSREVDIGSATGNYARSVALVSRLSPFSVYMLNDGKSVILTDSIAIPASNDLESRLVLVSNSKKIYSEHKGVLDESFDWVAFSVQLLDSVHTVIYNRSEIVKESFFTKENDDDRGQGKG